MIKIVWKTLKRWVSKIFSSDSILEYEGLCIIPGEQIIAYQGNEIYFTNREFQVLLLLIQYQGQVLSKKQIYEQVADDDSRINYHTIEITISRIRKKLREYTKRSDFIITVQDRGYKFKK